MPVNAQEVSRRRTFAIISHPDAGKTTLTEKLLLYGGAIQLAGTVKGRKAARHATSDWMELEKQRGISVTTSVMQFGYRGRVMNLLDTPGHADFSEDTYRTLTAVDSALMVIDAAKGVEERTVKLMEVCRLRNTPIITFINKLDREGREALELLDEVESVLGIRCAPVTWPVGMGKRLRGVYHIEEDALYLYRPGDSSRQRESDRLEGLHSEAVSALLGEQAAELRAEIELLRGASHDFDPVAYRVGRLTPVFFGSAINNFGVRELLDTFIEYAPPPLGRQSDSRMIAPEDDKFSGFVFKIQANMDPAHRDRIAFLRVVSGRFTKGMKLFQVRAGREIQVNNAITFMADDRDGVEVAYPGDIVGIRNHGTIRIGDTFTQGEDLRFSGVPSFAPELFKRVVLNNPLRAKALQKGLTQLSEEGATQVFRPLKNNDQIVGAVGVLQFDVAAYRLKHEYGVDCRFEQLGVYSARWIDSRDPKELIRFRDRNFEHLAMDGAEELVYIAPSRVNLELAQERWPGIQFGATREH